MLLWLYEMDVVCGHVACMGYFSRLLCRLPRASESSLMVVYSPSILLHSAFESHVIESSDQNVSANVLRNVKRRPSLILDLGTTYPSS